MSRRDQRGAQAVEFALVLPLLIMILFGITEFGRVYNLQAQVTQAARAGARVMALQNSSIAARTAVVAAAPGLGLTTGQVTITPSSCPSTGQADVVVRVSYPVNLMSGLFGARMTVTGTGVMRCQG